MKKGILVFATIFLVLLFFLAPAVDAGVGNSESGGSSLIDSGGGSSWSGGDSWSGGSSSYSSGSEVLPLLSSVVLLVYCII